MANKTTSGTKTTTTAKKTTAKKPTPEKKVAVAKPVEDKAKNFAWAKKCKAFTCVIGTFVLLEVIMQIAYIIFAMLKKDVPESVKQFGNAVAWVTIVFSIVEIVLLIILWTRTKVIKAHTGLNPLVINAGYPVVLGLAFILSLAASFVPSTNDVAVTVLYAVSAVLNIGMIVISFYAFAKIKKTIHE